MSRAACTAAPTATHGAMANIRRPHRLGAASIVGFLLVVVGCGGDPTAPAPSTQREPDDAAIVIVDRYGFAKWRERMPLAPLDVGPRPEDVLPPEFDPAAGHGVDASAPEG